MVKTKLVAASAALIVATSLAACGSSSGSGGGGEVKVGLLIDLSGPTSLFGTPTENVARLAVDEINKSGGVNGKDVKLVVADEAGVPTTGVNASRKMISRDRVSALFGMHSSATREAVAPVTAAAKVPYFYTAFFEGGICSANIVANGEVPAQQLKSTIPWAQEESGHKKWFVVGADYIWGRKVVDQAKTYVADAGGEVVGTELVPLGTTDFQSLITKIKASGADIMVPALVGGDAIAFEKQAFDAGIGNDKIQRLGVSYEAATRSALGKEVAAGMYNANGYDEAIDSPANTKFLEAYKTKFGPKTPAVTSISEQTYVALLAWAEAANKAKSTDQKKVLPNVPGITIEGPAGAVAFDENHYVTQSIFVTQARADGTSKVVKQLDPLGADESCSTPLG